MPMVPVCPPPSRLVQIKTVEIRGPLCFDTMSRWLKRLKSWDASRLLIKSIWYLDTRMEVLPEAQALR